jgi:hypothetical protein
LTLLVCRAINTHPLIAQEAARKVAREYPSDGELPMTARQSVVLLSALFVSFANVPADASAATCGSTNSQTNRKVRGTLTLAGDQSPAADLAACPGSGGVSAGGQPMSSCAIVGP